MSGNTKHHVKPNDTFKGLNLFSRKFRKKLDNSARDYGYPTNKAYEYHRLYTTDGQTWEDTLEETPDGNVVKKLVTAKRVEFDPTNPDYVKTNRHADADTESTIYHVLSSAAPSGMFYAIFNFQSGRWETITTGSSKCDTITFEIDSSCDAAVIDPDTTCGECFWVIPLAKEPTSICTDECTVHGIDEYTELVKVYDRLGWLFDRPITDMIGLTGWAKLMWNDLDNVCEWQVINIQPDPICLVGEST